MAGNGGRKTKAPNRDKTKQMNGRPIYEEDEFAVLKPKRKVKRSRSPAKKPAVKVAVVKKAAKKPAKKPAKKATKKG